MELYAHNRSHAISRNKVSRDNGLMVQVPRLVSRSPNNEGRQRIGRGVEMAGGGGGWETRERKVQNSQ